MGAKPQVSDRAQSQAGAGGGDLGEDSEMLPGVESTGLGGYDGLSWLGRLAAGGVAGGGEGTEASSGHCRV